MTEFVALANHRKSIRTEIARYAERSRAAQLAGADGRAPTRTGSLRSRLPPIVALLLMTGLSQVLSLERVLGVTAGHDATHRFVQSVIDRLEP